MSVSVIVVSYNTVEKLRRCLDCIEPEHEVIVVDNASSDGSPQMVARDFPHVRLVTNSENRGFGAANNEGAAVASGDWLLYLNSDCYAEPGAIRELARALDTKGAVAGGGKLLNPDGTLQESVAADLTLWMVFLEQTFLERAIRAWGHGYWRTPKQQSLVPQVMGACLMVKRGLDTFDERYFLYCEDTDLCKRLSSHGQIWYVPSAEFTHDLGSSSRKAPWIGIARYNAGKETYFRIHYGRLASYLCWLLNRGGALLRAVLWTLISILKPSKRSQASIFWRVLTARSRSLRH